MAIRKGSREQIAMMPGSIEEYVPGNAPVRVYDAFVDALCTLFDKFIDPAYNPGVSITTKQVLGVLSLILGIAGTILDVTGFLVFTQNWTVWMQTGLWTPRDATTFWFVLVVFGILSVFLDYLGYYLLK